MEALLASEYGRISLFGELLLLSLLIKSDLILQGETAKVGTNGEGLPRVIYDVIIESGGVVGSLCDEFLARRLQIRHQFLEHGGLLAIDCCRIVLWRRGSPGPRPQGPRPFQLLLVKILRRLQLRLIPLIDDLAALHLHLMSLVPQILLRFRSFSKRISECGANAVYLFLYLVQLRIDRLGINLAGQDAVHQANQFLGLFLGNSPATQSEVIIASRDRGTARARRLGIAGIGLAPRGRHAKEDKDHNPFHGWVLVFGCSRFLGDDAPESEFMLMLLPEPVTAGLLSPLVVAVPVCVSTIFRGIES